MLQPSHVPTTVVPVTGLVPVSGHLRQLTPIPPSRMFLINKSLAVFRKNHPQGETFDASQGDGGASLPGVAPEIFERAARLQMEHGSAYDMPYGTDGFRKAVVEQYWKFDAASGLGPANVLATVGGRDALTKAYGAMLAMGHGRQGDMILTTRVPWISYNWGPYGVGANVMLAPGSADDGWAYSEDGLKASVEAAALLDRKIAGIIITSPDNPTGNVLSHDRQVRLAKEALRLGVAFVLFDWMYHFIGDHPPMDLNRFIPEFDLEDRARLMFLDGITKSLGASNTRNAHLIANEEVIKHISAQASHSVIPSYFSMAVAMAAYEKGYEKASRSITGPTNASRQVLRRFVDDHELTAIIGQGYYAFIYVGKWLERKGWVDTEPLGQYLAEQHGLAIVPGAFFSPYGGQWIRFSYATPPAKTLGAAERLLEGLDALVNG